MPRPTAGDRFGGLGAAWRRKLTRSGREARGGSGIVTSEELELELVELGLSGERFGPPRYAEALGKRLGAVILFRLVDPLDDPAFSRRLALDGRLAYACYVESRNAVLINLPASLPPFLLVLVAFHELAHVAAGDVVEGKRVARRAPLGDENAREEEADVRARHLYLAGSLGEDNPYALALHRVP